MASMHWQRTNFLGTRLNWPVQICQRHKVLYVDGEYMLCTKYTYTHTHIMLDGRARWCEQSSWNKAKQKEFVLVCLCVIGISRDF